MKNEHWYFLIQAEYQNHGAFVNFYAYGEHLGDALNEALIYADQIGLSNCQLVEATRIDLINGFELPENLEKLSSEVQYQNSLKIFEKDAKGGFILPTGVIKSTEDSENDIDLIQEQFAAYAKDKNGIFELIMTVSQPNLKNVFYQCIDFLSNVNSIKLHLLNHWDNEDKTELWINRHKNEKGEILTFLKVNEIDLLENGFIEIVLNHKDSNTNLILDEHKQIRLTTTSQLVFNDFGKYVVSLGFKQTKDFYSIGYGYYHWHYRPAMSLNKASFRNFLSLNKFELKSRI